MWEQFTRTEQLLGAAAMQRLAAARVAVFGLGGVGGYAAEALARSGIGGLTLIDGDVISRSNLNRQILALLPDVGRPKVQVAAERLAAINPAAQICCQQLFYSAATAPSLPLGEYTYIVDAIDDVPAKIELILRAQAAGAPVISCMGAGNKLDPMAFQVADIYATSVCPLARVMRRELRRRGVQSLPVVYSTEPPLPLEPGRSPGSVAFVPPAAGLLLAAWVVQNIIKGE